jgi:hypothetical protein
MTRKEYKVTFSDGYHIWLLAFDKKDARRAQVINVELAS